jgi:hypothetical protein
MRILQLLILFYFHSACNTRTFSEHTPKFKILTSDTILLQSLSDKTNALNLSPINNGVDSFELRIWHGKSIVTPKILVILKYQDSAWKLTNTDYWFSYQLTNGSPEKIILDSSFTKSLTVPSNISHIIDSLYQYSLDTFPSQNEIPNFQDKVADGLFYQIEVATSKSYKVIEYNNPNRYIDNHNLKMSKLITMLNSIGVYSMP